MNGHAQYAPDFDISFGSAPMPAAMRACVTGINYTSALEGADRVEVSLVNDGLRWLDDNLLSLDNQLVLSLGYAGQLRQVFVGEIVSKSAGFPGGGAPTLTIAAQDRMRHLQRGTKTRWFAIAGECSPQFIPDPFVAGMIAAENGFLPMLDPVAAVVGVVLAGINTIIAMTQDNSTQRLIRKQEGMSDYDFLKIIAAENGWEMRVEHEGPAGGFVLRFTSMFENVDPDVYLDYGRSLIEFTPRITNVGQVLSFSVRVWQSDTKLEFTITISWDWDRQALDVSISPGYGQPAGMSSAPGTLRQQAQMAGDQAADARAQGRSAEAQSLQRQSNNLESQGQRQEEQLEQSSTSNASVTLLGQQVNLATAPRLLMSKLLPKLNNRLTGSGSAVGDPRIRAGRVVELGGLGREFSGRYRVTSATHTLDSSGYRTSFEGRKEVWFGSVPEMEKAPLSLQGQRLG